MELTNMQTFLPYYSFDTSAKCLDDKRLGKQRVEAKQIYLALTDPDYGWKNHPAVRMWQGYEGALATYGVECCRAWRARGFNDSLLEFFEARAPRDAFLDMPYWLGYWEFHISHQSNLVRKDPDYYQQHFPNMPGDLPYFWPAPRAKRIVPTGVMLGVTNDETIVK